LKGILSVEIRNPEHTSHTKINEDKFYNEMGWGGGAAAAAAAKGVI